MPLRLPSSRRLSRVLDLAVQSLGAARKARALLFYGNLGHLENPLLFSGDYKLRTLGVVR